LGTKFKESLIRIEVTVFQDRFVKSHAITQVQSHAISCGIYGGQSGTGTILALSTALSFCQHPTLIHSFFTNAT